MPINLGSRTIAHVESITEIQKGMRIIANASIMRSLRRKPGYGIPSYAGTVKWNTSVVNSALAQTVLGVL